MVVRGKGVFLTGGAVGIGRAAADLLLNRGAKLFFVDIDTTKGQEAEKELKAKYPSCDICFAVCDVTESTQLNAVFEEAVQRFGAVEICINNAGRMDEANWRKTIALNQVAQMEGSMLALEHMRKDKGGRGGAIINVTSINSFYYGVWEFPVYASTKHAMAAFTTGWANSPDNGQHGIQWGCVCPDACFTALNMWEREDQCHVKMADRQARDTTNWLTPTEASYAFLTLLDDPESNGGLLKIFKDGGQLFQELWLMDKSAKHITSLAKKYTKQEAV